MTLTQEQLKRYARHISLKEIGEAGQEKLLNAKVLIIGVGGLGSPAALYLAAAGVGTIGLADGDKVDITNLQRQIIHSMEDIGRNKTASAKARIAALNPDIKVETHESWIDASNIEGVIKNYDFVIDGTDNFSDKFLINDACVIHKKPFSHAGVLTFHAQTMTYLPGSTCYRCVFDAPPPLGALPSCSEVGVLGVVPGIVGAVQSAEAVKYILGIGDLLVNKLLTIDITTMNFRSIGLRKNAQCPVCGADPTIKNLENRKRGMCKNLSV